jgi:hypothetical protein
MNTALRAHTLVRMALTALLWATGAAVAQTSPWYVAGALSTTHDSNLLRLFNSQQAVPGQSKSDVVYSTTLLGGLDQFIGRQRLQGRAAISENRYERNERYNNQTYDGTLGLQWATIERISGSLNATATRRLSNLNIDGVGLITERNYETSRGMSASISKGLVTEFSLDLAAGTQQLRNSLDLAGIRARDFDQDSASIGLSWRPSPDLTVSGGWREIRGEYPRFRVVNGAEQSDRFAQRQLELGVSSQLTGASGIDLRLSTARTGYNTDSVRDFSAVNGSLAWNWVPTGRLRMTSRIAREDGRDSYPSVFLGIFPITVSDRRAITTAAFQINWDYTAKVAFTGGLQLTRRPVTRELLASNGQVFDTQSGIDNTTSWAFGVRWTPTRSTLLGCDARDEQRRVGGTITGPLRGRTLTCFGQLTLQ